MTSSDSTIVSISDTTADGRVFYNDLVWDDIYGEMFRTNRVGMDIIREIHADRKRQKRIADSLKVENRLLIDNFNDCQESLVVAEKEKSTKDKQLELKKKMLSNEIDRNDLADKQIKKLNTKVKIGKVGWSVAGVFFGVSVVTTVILIIQK